VTANTAHWCLTGQLSSTGQIRTRHHRGLREPLPSFSPAGRRSLAGSGVITWNGTPYISISGPADKPVLRGPTGQPLTAQEALVARSVMRLSDDVFDLVEELVEPVEELLLLGWLL